MASGNMKDIKRRIKSVQSTMQITKAMELVASSKMRRAKERALSVRPYFNAMYETVARLASVTRDSDSVYTRRREVKNSLYIVIAGDRGLAGGYNNNILKLVYSQMEEGAAVLPIGKKAVEYFKRKNVTVITESYAEAASVSIGDCYTIAKMLADGFLDGSFGKLTLGYTNFVSMLSQTPSTLDLLPLRVSTEKRPSQNTILYEPGSEAVFNAIVLEYLGGVLYGALCESTASEQAARRTAMDSATKNADEIIDDLNLRYNRARQGAITQEITEIVAGAEQS